MLRDLVPQSAASRYNPEELETALQAMPMIIPYVGRLRDLNLGANQLTLMASLFLEGIGEERFGQIHFSLLFGEDPMKTYALLETAQEVGWVSKDEMGLFSFNKERLRESQSPDKLYITAFDLNQ